MDIKTYIKFIIIFTFIISNLIGISHANNSDQIITTYYVSIEPDLEGNSYFQIDVQNFDYNQSIIFGVAAFEPNVYDYNSAFGKKSYSYEINTPDTSIDIFYSDGKIDTIDYYKVELEFLGSEYVDVPVPSQMYYISTTDQIKNNNISNFKIKFYDSNFRSENYYYKYPFDKYKFTYDIIFLNNSNVIYTILPKNPNNFYEMDVSLNHIYKNKSGSNFEEIITPIYDRTYKINYKTKNNESLNEINILYTRKIGLAHISFFILVLLLISSGLCIVFSNNIPKELNAIIFATILTIYTFLSSIGFSYEPNWLNTYSYFDILFYLDLIVIVVCFKLLVNKWRKKE